MILNIKAWCLLMAGMVLGNTLNAQDIHFSQFYEAPLLRNPSLAGIYTGDVRAQMLLRDQWNSVTNAYKTGSLNAEYKMQVGKGDDFMTTGIQMLFDKAGTVGLTSTHILPAFNYHKSLSDEKIMYLSAGFMGGLVRKSFDISKMATDDQWNGGEHDPSLPSGETFGAPNFNTWNASVGVSFNTSFGEQEKNTMFVGAAFHHLNRPRNSFYRDENIELHPKYVFSAGFRFKVNEFSEFTLQADHSIQGSYGYTIAGGLYSYGLGPLADQPEVIISGGAFLRWQDALIPVLKIDKKPVSVSISYDINVSPLKTASLGRGGIELSVSYMGFLNKDNSTLNKVLCPRF